MSIQTPEEFKKLMPTGIYIFVPAFLGQLFDVTLKSVAKAAHILGSLDVPMRIGTVSHPDIADVRNGALSVWHEKFPDCSHILFVDADMGFEPKLILDMLAFNQPIVGAVYPKKQDTREWVINIGPTEDSQRLISRCGGFVSCDGLGGGCLLIRRDAIDEMVAAYPELVETDMETIPMKGALKKAGITRFLKLFDKITLPSRVVISEDLAFCKRWLDLNLSAPATEPGAQGKDSRMDHSAHHIWAAIGHKLDHMGPKIYSGNFKEEMIDGTKS